MHPQQREHYLRLARDPSTPGETLVSLWGKLEKQEDEFLFGDKPKPDGWNKAVTEVREAILTNPSLPSEVYATLENSDYARMAGKNPSLALERLSDPRLEAWMLEHEVREIDSLIDKGTWHSVYAKRLAKRVLDSGATNALLRSFAEHIAAQPDTFLHASVTRAFWKDKKRSYPVDVLEAFFRKGHCHRHEMKLDQILRTLVAARADQKEGAFPFLHEAGRLLAEGGTPKPPTKRLVYHPVFPGDV